MSRKVLYQDEKKIIKQLEEVNWDTLDTATDPDEMYENVENLISKIYLQNTKQTKVTNNRFKGKKEWVSTQNLKDIHLKNKIWKKIRIKAKSSKNINHELISQYRQLKNKIRRDLEENKQNFLKKKIDENKNVWDMVNKITGIKTRNLDEVIKKQCNAHWQTVMELIYLLNWAIKNNKINDYMLKSDEDETVLNTQQVLDCCLKEYKYLLHHGL